MNHFPLISIITLNYNQTKTTCDFLESCKNLIYPNYEILVCDMNSEISPEPEINSSKFPFTRLILSDKNLGFAGGNNLGMQEANGDYFFIVNNDTILPEDILNVLIKPFLENKNIGMISPKIKYYSQPDVIQYAGFTEVNFKTGRTFAIGHQKIDEEKYSGLKETAGVHGCAFLVSKEVYLITRGFDERFFLYYEEWDWSERVKKAGFKILYCGDCHVLHKDSITVGKRSLLKEYYLNRNRIVFTLKHADKNEALWFKFYYKFIVYPFKILKYILKGEITRMKTYRKAYRDSKALLK